MALAKHVAFNPMWGSIQNICSKLEEDGWILDHIVAVHQYEAVAIFIKPEALMESLIAKNRETEEEETPEEGGGYI